MPRFAVLILLVLASCDSGPSWWVPGDTSHAGRRGERVPGPPIAWWPLDGDAVDASGNGHDGRVHGAVPTADRHGHPADAMRFDGVDDWIDFGTSPLLKPDFPITITMWVRADRAGGSAPFANSFDPPDNTGVWVAFSSDRNRPAVGAGYGGPAGGSSRMAAIGRSPIPLGEWVHVAAVLRSTSDVSIWLDGVEETVELDRAGGRLQYGPGPAVAGVRKSGLTLPLLYFAGALDELRLYDRELTVAEIHLLAGRTAVRER